MVRARVAWRCFTVVVLLGLVAAASAQESLTINGTATYLERRALPPDAVFEVTLKMSPAPVLWVTSLVVHASRNR